MSGASLFILAASMTLVGFMEFRAWKAVLRLARGGVRSLIRQRRN